MSEPLRAGVIGAGVFGGHHAAQYARRADVRLLAVHDPHPERAAALAAQHGARACTTLGELLAMVDVVSIAAPAHAHATLARAALAAGKHAYIEKPIATSLADADAIVAAGRAAGLVVACGLLERAAIRAIGLATVAERPLAVATWRLTTPTPRCLDVSVVLDLMIHDLDLALTLAGGEPLSVEAEGACVRNRLLDEAAAEVVFDGGLVASLTASRVAEIPRRVWRIVYPSGVVEIDLAAHSLINHTPFALQSDFGERSGNHDRLGASLDAFIAAVRGGGEPLADALAGTGALDLALAVEQAVEEGG